MVVYFFPFDSSSAGTVWGSLKWTVSGVGNMALQTRTASTEAGLDYFGLVKRCRERTIQLQTQSWVSVFKQRATMDTVSRTVHW